MNYPLVHCPRLPEIIKHMNCVVMGMIETYSIHEVHDLFGLERSKIDWRLCIDTAYPQFAADFMLLL